MFDGLGAIRIDSDTVWTSATFCLIFLALLASHAAAGRSGARRLPWRRSARRSRPTALLVAAARAPLRRRPDTRRLRPPFH